MTRLRSMKYLAIALLGASACMDQADEATESGLADSESASEIESASYALKAGTQGFAWVNLSNGNVSPTYSYSTSGGPISVASNQVGRYVVTFGGLASPGGNAQVVASGLNDVRCHVSSWAPVNANLTVGVQCRTAAGAFANSDFVVRFARATGGFHGNGAYLWANNAGSANYEPAAAYQWNSTGGVNHITHDTSAAGTGKYEVFLPGLADTAGSVQVTAYGTDGEHCKVQSWGPVGTEQRVIVRCFNASGAALNTRFSLNYFGHMNVSVQDRGAYAYAHLPTTASYSPSASYSYNSGVSSCGPLGTNTAGRLAGLTGRYFMRHTLLAASGATPHVTAYGSDSSYCKLEGWADTGANAVEVGIGCWDEDGNRIDTKYVETYSTKFLRPPC